MAKFDFDRFVGATIGGVVADSVMTPFGAVGYAVLYFELRRLENEPPLESNAWGSEDTAS